MGIVECLGILTLQVMKEVDPRVDPLMVRNLMVKERRLCVTSVTTLDTLQGIVKHLRIRMEPTKGEIYLYVSYATTLDTQFFFV